MNNCIFNTPECPDGNYCINCGYPFNAGFYEKNQCRGGIHPHIPKFAMHEIVACEKCSRACYKSGVTKDNKFTLHVSLFPSSDVEAGIDWSRIHFGCYLSDEEFNIKDILT